MHTYEHLRVCMKSVSWPTHWTPNRTPPRLFPDKSDCRTPLGPSSALGRLVRWRTGNDVSFWREVFSAVGLFHTRPLRARRGRPPARWDYVIVLALGTGWLALVSPATSSCFADAARRMTNFGAKSQSHTL